ncbi:MAG TPA: hypothetical protein VHO72_05775 [Bacteroidales bacterium]|nr:hypothetical protein [Bacteroidales bacterium]
METIKSNDESFTESQSLEVIREMLKVSQKKLKNDGILLIVWGWILFINYAAMFLAWKVVMTYQLSNLLKYSTAGLVVAGVIFTIYYIYRQRKKVQTYIGVSLRYVWGSVLFCMVLINLILFNVLHKSYFELQHPNRAYFELQHPIFMVIFSFAVVVTGSILRNKLIILGGIVFGLLAYLSSFLALPEQLLLEAIAWLIALIIPGHLLYAKRNK